MHESIHFDMLYLIFNIDSISKQKYETRYSVGHQLGHAFESYFITFVLLSGMNFEIIEWFYRELRKGEKINPCQLIIMIDSLFRHI